MKKQSFQNCPLCGTTLSLGLNEEGVDVLENQVVALCPIIIRCSFHEVEQKFGQNRFWLHDPDGKLEGERTNFAKGYVLVSREVLNRFLKLRSFQ